MTTTEDVDVMVDDPCPDAVRIGSSLAFLHARRPVRCEGCGRPMRYAWFLVDAHYCGRCRWGPGDE